jgi:hypothetical protein
MWKTSKVAMRRLDGSGNQMLVRLANAVALGQVAPDPVCPVRHEAVAILDLFALRLQRLVEHGKPNCELADALGALRHMPPTSGVLVFHFIGEPVVFTVLVREADDEILGCWSVVWTVDPAAWDPQA